MSGPPREATGNFSMGSDARPEVYLSIRNPVHPTSGGMVST